MTQSESDPAVSIILPTYNRASFMAQAFLSIRSQLFDDWELIVVDDGGTDNTRELVDEMSHGLSQQVRYVYQENQGPAAARNHGLDLANGRYIAFFDSDDVWLNHHLKDCVEALEDNRDVDWFYGASRVVDYESGNELERNSFYLQGQPKRFLSLRTRQAAKLRIIDDPAATECMISYGLMCGLQNSVFRARCFETLRLPPYSVGEDQIFVLMALKAGFRLAYFDDVHVTYHVHAGNTSAASSNDGVDRRVQVHETLLRALEESRQSLQLTRRETRALNHRLANEYFWRLGYAVLWQNGRAVEALKRFRLGISHRPLDWRLWKTYLLATTRLRLGLAPPMSGD